MLDRRAAVAGAIGSLGAAFSASGASATTATADWIPIDVDAQHIRVQVDLDGEPFTAIVDSGAAGSVLDVRLARRLGLRARSGLIAQGVGASTAAATAGPLSLRLGRVAWTLDEVAVVDLAAVRQAGAAAFAILGRDLFEPRVVRFDFLGSRMRLEPTGRSGGPGEPSAPLLPAPHALRQTSVTLEGGPPCAAEFDLGNGSPLLVSRAYADARGFLAGRRTSSWIGAGVEGVTGFTTATLETVRVGSTTFRHVPIEVYDAWSTPEVPVNLGLPLLSRFDLATDYPANRLWLGAAPRTRSPFPHDRSGLACKWDDDALLVLHVARGSPASRAGWRGDERITRIDGVRVSRAALGWGQGDAGVSHTLTLSDATTRHMTLEDYY